MIAHELQDKLNFEWKLITDGTFNLLEEKYLGIGFVFIYYYLVPGS
jgi:hypothetical protein